MNKKTRDSNIELLRIILMLMIILHHLIVHGGGLSGLAQGKQPVIGNTPLLIFINSFLILAVDCYIFISAYFGIKFSLKGLISFILQATFYSSVIYIIACFTGWESWSIPNFYRSLIPILSGKWWFLSGYVLLFILSPILNDGLLKLNKQQHIFIAVSMVIIAASFYITNFSPDSSRVNISNIGLFLTIYVVGSYFRKFPVDIKYPFVGYFLSSIIIFTSVFFYYCFVSYESAWNIFGYTNPIVILAAIFLFFAFKKIKLQSSFINKVSTLTFGVYLIHDADPVRRFLIHLVQGFHISNIGVFLATIVGLALVIFIVCSCIEKVRQVLFMPIADYIMKLSFIKKLNL